MSAKFQKAVSIIKNLPKTGAVQPSQDEQLKFYGLYKQATEGDVNTPRPGMMEFTAKYKWDAWNAVKGKPKAEAEAEYVALFKEVLTASGTQEGESYIKEIDEA
ncbi:hypothetical protein FRB96_007906 [Tulasnella sp. 330]|nr:hypothetical protein FRB96_007906 [Tulasnella sp. 330]KAG8875876.1 hypothetical protein FRB97_004671 [Tulasnella sp. 331]KAG8881308.1 hypothetical protein FRB98_004420 [Tulasnella sp. 332]